VTNKGSSSEVKQAIARIEHLLVTNEFSDRVFVRFVLKTHFLNLVYKIVFLTVDDIDLVFDLGFIKLSGSLTG
jgi:hypothetical protein